MNPESRMRQVVVKALKPLHALAVENEVYPGTPDVNFIEGWIELKRLREPPARATTVVRIPHFTPQQRTWLMERHHKGGCALLLLQVGKEWLLFDGKTAALQVGKLTMCELKEVCLEGWHGTPPAESLIATIEDAMTYRRKDED